MLFVYMYSLNSLQIIAVTISRLTQKLQRAYPLNTWACVQMKYL